jgi:serine/threonine-protein kinase
MKHPNRIGRRLGRVFFPKSFAEEGSVDSQLADMARRRLGLAAIVIGVAFGVVPMVFGRIYQRHFGTDLMIRQVPITFLSIFLISALIYAVTRMRGFPAQRALKLGVLYEWILAFALSLLEVRVLAETGISVDRVMWGVSTVCIVILVFPLLLPMGMWKTAGVAMVAALTGPLAYFLVIVPNLGRIGWEIFLPMYIANIVCADLATIPAWIVRRLSGEVTRARELGSYRLVEKLGEGGMGEVWRAEHRLLARPAAVKFIQAKVMGTDEESRRRMLRRFEREAQSTALLQSPHTIDLYDFGVGPDGSFYYVMELLDGLDLDEIVRLYGPQPAERVAGWMIQACHSLRNAHEQGLIHRDIKPGNLYVCRSGSDVDVIKVLDFGLVKSNRLDDSGETRLTRQGVITGTPSYMAPEMVLEEGKIDGRADLYSLGCVAYWLLTSTPVFEADSAMKVMVMHAKDAPVPPSRRTEMEIPAALEEIILRCLAKDPADRPQSARELSEWLKACVAGETWSESRAREWWEIHRPREDPRTIDAELAGPIEGGAL